MNTRSIGWVSWQRICESKLGGIMWFKDLKIFNLALLANWQGWRVLQDEFSLLHKIYKAGYFPHVNFLESKLSQNHSYAWRGIWVVKQNLKKWCMWRVGNRKSINIWTDHWIPRIRSINQNLCEEGGMIREGTVNNLIDNNSKWWDVGKVRNLLPPQANAEVLKIIGLNPSKHANKLINGPLRRMANIVWKVHTDSLERLERRQWKDCSNASR